MRKHKKNSIEKRNAMYGRAFVLLWEIGFVLFFFIPLLQSIFYSFSNVSFDESGVTAVFNGLFNYDYILNQEPDYVNNITKSIVSFIYSLPIVLIISLALALILNQKFKGRLIARAVFFLPVIIATGVIITIMSQDMVATSLRDSTSDTSAYMFSGVDFMRILMSLDLPEMLVKPIMGWIGEIFNLIWNSGIQILLFIAGLQAIPEQLYEVAEVEGAPAWERFWFITFPMLLPVLILNAVYTTIELLTNMVNPVIDQAYSLILRQTYDLSSAMLWLYFGIIGAIIGAVMLLINRIFVKKWA